MTMTFPADSAENVAYTYDQSGHGSGVGRLTSVTDAAGALSRSYDQFGNLLTDARTAGTVNLTTTYTYDPANRIASITYPSGTIVRYIRDTMGRITTVSAQPNGGSSTTLVSSVTYEPFGPDKGFRCCNAGQETRGFDQDYRLTNVTDVGGIRRGEARVLENLTYTYYPTNNVQTITDAVTSGNSQSFSYDSLERLSQAAGSYGSFGFTYDGDGNQLTQTLGATTTSYGYGAGNDLLATISVGGVETQSIGYTADGRMGSLNPGIQAPAGQYITSLSYNQDARLSAVSAASGALASYTYDGFGQRLIKTVSASYGEIYQYGQNGMLLEETNASGAAQADYIYLNGRPIATLNNPTGALYMLHDDILGTPQLAADNDQNIQWQANYEPFGQTTSVSGTITQNLRLPGQYFDVESGWNHNGFRDYLPGFGRYIEPDPLGIQGDSISNNPMLARFLIEGPLAPESHPNLYAYVVDDPIDLADPLGLRPLTDCEKQVLGPFIPKIDLDNANLHDGQVPWYLGKDYEGITRGNDIYFRQGVYDPSTIDGLATLGHELVHVGQYRNGMTFAKYLWASRHGYDKNPYEKPAYDKEAEIKAALMKENCQGCKN